MPEGFQEVSIGDGVVVEDHRREQFPVERGGAQHGGEPLVGEHPPQDPETEPEIVVLRVGGTKVQQPAQPGHPVVLPI